jgi:ADP-dependent NAD(P)H-hydrate dehydratase / NAD(P)H-hydrate epimerase
MRAAYAVADVIAAEHATDAGPGPTLLADGTLMERASHGLAAAVAGLLPRVYGARVVLLVGTGNNGGDALFAGALLARRGARVDALLTHGEAPVRVHAAGLAALLGAGGRAVRWGGAPEVDAVLAQADVVVDGMVGIGSSGGLRGPAAALAARLPDTAPVVAVDVPSGVDADTGEVHGTAVSADVTVTFGACKPGLLVAPGAHHAGAVLEVDIGLQPYLAAPPAVESLDASDVRALLRAPSVTDDKYARGVVGVLAGSEQYAGAAVLAVAGALGAGPGMVRFASVPAAAEQVRARWPETIVTALPVGAPVDLDALGRVQAWVCGPGAGTDDAAAALLGAVLATGLPVVLDAAALQLLAERPELVRVLVARTAITVLTPHAGELGRLLDAPRSDIEAAPLSHVRAAADRFGATVLLKGSATLVASPHGAAPVRANRVATPWLAAAGSGDVLAGVVGTLLAAGLDARDAASAGAWLHAAAGAAASSGGPLTASRVAAALPGVVAALLAPPDQEDSPS